MIKVLALMKYGDRAASTRQRLLQFVPALEASGFTVDVHALFDNTYLLALANRAQRSLLPVAGAYVRRARDLLNVGQYDIVFLPYETFPYLPAAFERIVAARSRALIYDFDDAIFHQYDGHRNPLVRALLGRKLAPLLERADVCICGNAYLEVYARRYSSRTVIIPTVVDADRYKVAAPPSEPRRPIVGWMGSPSTFEQLRPVLELLSRHKTAMGFDLRVIGSGLPQGAIPGVDFAPWSEATEVADIGAMDIGIMPLPDEAWARGKCGYKLIQYMACGLPVVASPVGVNSDIVVEGVTGFLAKTDDRWLDSLSVLVNSSTMRRLMGQKGRENVVKQYSLEAQAPRLVAAFQAAARDSCAA